MLFLYLSVCIDLFFEVDENNIVCVLFIFIMYFVFKLIFVKVKENEINLCDYNMKL